MAQDTVDSESLPVLRFNKPLISTPQRPISSKDLLIRLQQLHQELSSFSSESPDLNLFETIKNDLVNSKLLKSSNGGILAYACCALADIFRIFAPDAPFTNDQLSMIFSSFFKQFKKLSDSSNPYFQQQCYLLKRLAEVRSTILITDLDDSEVLMETLFSVFYDLSNKEFPQKLEPLICEILSDIMAEAEVVPHDVLRMILDKLVFTGEKLGAKVSNPGFNFSVSICEANVDRMSRQVAQYFSEMLYESSNSHENFNDRVKNLQGLETLKRVHKLSVQIWRYVPGLLNAVMGLIDEELNADDETIRMLATETIGQMIAQSNSFSNFFIYYKDTWFNWLKKTLDISSNVRSKWVEQIPSIINNIPSLTSDVSSELCNGLNKCLMDSDEKVRLVSCVSLEKVTFEKFTRVFKKDTMSILGQLIRERNPDIRKQAINILSNHCNSFFMAISSNTVLDFGDKSQQESEELQEKVFREIPNQILSLVYINDMDINYNLDLCFFEKILPFEENTVKRVNRLCQLFETLNEKSKSAFFAINSRQQRMSKSISQFIKLCEEYGKDGTLGGKENQMTLKPTQSKQILLNKLDKAVKWFCESMPQGINSELCLERFYKLKNFRLFHVMKLAISPDSDFLTVKNALKELLTKLGQPKNIRVESDSTTISTTDMTMSFKLIMYRASLIIYNKSNILELINYSRNTKHEWNAVSNEILNDISIAIPGVFKNHIQNLMDVITDDSIDHMLRSKCLQTVYQIILKYPELYPAKLDKTLFNICLEGTPNETEYSMKLIKFSSKKYLYCTEILEKVFPLNTESTKLTNHLAAIAEILLIEPDLLDDKISDLTADLIKKILLNNTGKVPDNDNATDWLSDDDLIKECEHHNELNQKLLALKIFTNRLKSLEARDAEQRDINEVATPIIKLFQTIISSGGEIVNDSEPTPLLYQLRLRLHAGWCLLQLGECTMLQDYFNNEVLNSLVYLLQDQNEYVRESFLKELERSLSKGMIPEKFLVVLSFMNHEPRNDILAIAETWIRSMSKRAQRNKDIKFERAIVRLIHLISHNPNFAKKEQEKDAYEYAAEVLIFFINLIINADNISLLYYLASRVKQFRDATIDQSNYDIRPYNKEVNNLYCVAELAQLIIKEFGELKNWSTLSWPGKVSLPSDLFTPMLSTNEAQAIISKVYIPESLQAELRPFIRHKFVSPGKRKASTLSSVVKRAKVRETGVTKASRSIVGKAKPKAARASKPKTPRAAAVEPEVEYTKKSLRPRTAVSYGEGDDSENENSASDDSDSASEDGESEDND